MHPNDRLEFLVSGHPGSKKHKRGKSLRQKHRDRILKIRKTRTARVATVRRNRNAEASEAGPGVTARPADK
jgi:hypothetical protein